MTYYRYDSYTTNMYEMWYNFKETLKLAGWVVTSSGTGNSGTYNASGDNLVSPTSFSTNAWWVCEHPTLDGYKRYLSIQVSTVNARIKIAWTPYSSGSPSTIVTPTSTTQQVLIGSGTDASPTLSNMFFTNGNNILCIIGDASEKYSFYLTSMISTYNTQPQNIYTLFAMQYLNNSHALDIDPYVYVASYSSTLNLGISSANALEDGQTTAFNGWYKKDLSGAAWVKYYPCFYSATGYFNSINSVGSDPYNNKTVVLPCVFSRTITSNQSIKGTARDMNISPVPFQTGKTVSVIDDLDRIFIGPYFMFKLINGVPIQ